MSRLFTTGLEIGMGTQTDGTFDGKGDFGIPVRDNAHVRSGSWALKSPAAGQNQWAVSALVQNNGLYARAYIYVDVLPAANMTFFQLRNGTSSKATVVLTTTGKLQLWAGDTPAQIGSDSVTTIATGAWYRVEVYGNWNSGTPSASSAELRLDGTSVASSSAIQMGGTLDQFILGWTSGSSGTSNMWFDDMAVNDGATATNQNSWPGSGKVVLLLPTADSAVGTGWTLGTGTAISANSGSTAVKNAPPVGVADLAAGSDTKQIRNATANANVNYDATMTTYSAAGVVAGDTVNVIVPIVNTAAPVVTSAKQGTVGVVSNPAIANIALGAGGTAGAFWSGTAGGAWGTGWKTSNGTITYAPSVTVGTAPVMRITQVTSSTRIAVVCSMFIYVDYTPATQVPYTSPYPQLLPQ